ncbi:magnetosome protein Mad6 [Fundidesulfovibrio magnetotacticus]|uniref:Magnetosome protein Mad6 n=1 Tax=Fundidesulfovibrio magnetotacticus TaxID=2730080 RepID=A0A6V8LVL8_9BACT|nr:4Fe-4S binding protein [Fundidesulfovibrio magnetotacticus]GFK92295.1 magnetosome protein Mad6 [Fundidesulfovibrio magnetotacticus]
MQLPQLRTFIQAASAILSNGYVGSLVTRYVNTNQLKGVCVPYLNCYACPSALYSCPIGTLQHFMAIRSVPYMLLGMIGLVGAITGRMACGWACPFGFFQELLHRFPSPKFQIPRAFRHVKWAVLAVTVLFVPWLTASTLFCKLCPAGGLLAAVPWVAWNPVNPFTGAPVLPVAPDIQYVAVVLGVAAFLVAFVFVKRIFCKMFCPMGAILALFNSISFVRLEMSPDCDDCSACNASCPMDLDVPVELNSTECIRCFECTKCGHVKIVTSLNARSRSDAEIVS